jgi:hypothetical protein
MKILHPQLPDIYEVHLLDSGIITVHNIDKREQTVEDQKLLIEIIGELTDKKRIPILHTFDQFSLPGKDIRNAWASNDICLCSKADAFVISSIGQKILGNFYLNIDKPQRPSRLFTDKTKALEWLITFV